LYLLQPFFAPYLIVLKVMAIKNARFACHLYFSLFGASFVGLVLSILYLFSLFGAFSVVSIGKPALKPCVKSQQSCCFTTKPNLILVSKKKSS